uniref:Uncharacterized protein n=1 Tax=Arundo donax TaxID=35708 RepID=A0A0A8ZTA6_ARUDO
MLTNTCHSTLPEKQFPILPFFHVLCQRSLC